MILVMVLMAVWIVAAPVALAYSIVKLRKARADLNAHVADGTNGAVLYSNRWRLHAAKQGVALSTAFVMTLMFSLADIAIDGPSVFTGVLIVSMTAAPLIWAWLQRDDDHAHERLVGMIMTRPDAPSRRKMDSP